MRVIASGPARHWIMLVPGDGKFLRFLHIREVAMGKVLNIKFLQGYCHRNKSGFQLWQQFSISDLATSTVVCFFLLWHTWLSSWRVWWWADVSNLGRKYTCAVHGVSRRVLERSLTAQTDSVMYSVVGQDYCRAEIQKGKWNPLVVCQSNRKWTYDWLELWLNNSTESSQCAMYLLLHPDELILITWKM